MIISPIPHYSLENPATVYDEESLTALQLAARTAAKVNEAVEAVNENTTRVREAEEYMVEKLPEFVEDRVDELQENGTLETTLVQAVSARKVDKGGVGQVTYSMLAQDAREAMTGGNTPVVGENAVGAVNVIDFSLPETKQTRNNFDCWMYYPYITGYRVPLVTIDTAAGTATINRDLTSNMSIYHRDSYSVISPSGSCVASYEKTTTAENAELFYNAASKVLHICDAARPIAHPECIYLGGIANNKMRRNNVVPFTLNGVFYPAMNTEMHPRQIATLTWIPQRTADVSTPTPAIIDTVNKKIVFKEVNRFIMFTEGAYFEVDELKASGENYEVSFDGLSGWIYIVGDETGVKCISATEFASRPCGYAEKDMFLLGYFHDTHKIAQTNFPIVFGESVSFLGDSITTFTGYIPEGNAAYYKGNNAGVTHYRQTWWARVCDEMGWILNTNNAWSGARVSTSAGLTSDGVDPSGVARASLLDNGTDPDNIIVYLGINDFQNEVAIGSYNGDGLIPTTTDTFREGYAVMLKNIMTNYPRAKIHCMTLPPLERDYKNAGHPEQNGNGVYLTAFNRAIREICDAFGVEVIEAASCGFNAQNASIYMGDYNSSNGGFLHPNAAGHKLIADKVVRCLKKGV